MRRAIVSWNQILDPAKGMFLVGAEFGQSDAKGRRIVLAPTSKGRDGNLITYPDTVEYHVEPQESA